MIPNFVIFGPTHSGKSTLATYLLVTKDPKRREEFYRFKNEIKNEPKFHEKKYAWFMDRVPVEREKSTESRKKTGTSQVMHPWPLCLDDLDNYPMCNLIDTPGMDARVKERIKGIFWGDIGIFVAECNELNKDLFMEKKENTISRYINPLILWSKIGKKVPKLIVLLSKMDQVQFSKEKYETAKTRLELICRENNFPEIHFIPICVELTEEIDHNITSKSTKMEWYEGPTLFEVMENLSEKSHLTKEIRKQLIITLQNERRSVTGTGEVVAGKILSGQLKTHDSIKIVPIKYGGKIDSLYAKVKSIHIQRRNVVSNANEGAIVGIALYDESINNKRAYLSDCTLCKTSLLIQSDTPVEMGNILILKVFSQDNREFHYLDSLQLIWHGRMVASTVIFIRTISDVTDIGICLNRDAAAIPKNESNNFCFTKFILRINDDYIRTTMMKIGFIASLEFDLTPPFVNNKDLQKNFANYSYNIKENKIKFINLTNSNEILELVRKIKKCKHTKCENAFPILESLQIRMR